MIKENKINPDCSDLRIYYNDQIQKDKIIYDCGKNKTYIYFRIDEDLVNGSYYLYYGNKNASLDYVNKSNVYYFFDDFENYNVSLTPPYNGWYSNGGVWRIDNSKSKSGNKSVFENGLYINWVTLNNTNIDLENFTYSSYAMIGTQANVWSFGISFNVQNKSGFRYQVHWEYHIGSGIGGWTFQLRKVLNDMHQHYTLGAVYPSNYSYYNLTPPEINKWYEFKVIRSYPNIKVFFDNKLIFDVNDSTFKNGSIGFSRYSNIEDINRKSWYDDAIVTLYIEPWPQVYLGPEEEIKPVNITFNLSKMIYINTPQKIYVNMFQQNQPIVNLTFNDFNITVPQTSIEKISFENYKNGTYFFEIKIQTNNLGKKQFTLMTPFSTAKQDSYILTEPKENSIIITNDDWKNYIASASTNKTVLVTNSSNLISLYEPKQIFFLNSNIPTNIEHYYIDRETLYLMFFKNKEIIVPSEKNVAIKSSSINLPIVIEPTEEILSLLKPKKIYNISSIQESENLYLLKSKTTNYIILVNENSDKSFLSSSLAFKHNGFIILFSGDANQAKQKLKDKIHLSRYKYTLDFKLKNKLFLALIDAPYFFVNDPVNDGLIDYDGDEIKTDVFYADLNDDGYLDLSVSRLEGSFEAMTHQIYFEPKTNKNALIVSVYDTPQILDLFYSVPLMKYSQMLRGYLKAYGFNVTTLVERRASKETYTSEEIGSIIEDIKNYVKDDNFDGLLSQLKFIFSTFNEAVYLLVEFDWSEIFDKILSNKNFVLKHFPIYNEENIISHASKKDIILYMAFGNKTHWYFPSNGSIKITSLPSMQSFVYLYYPQSYESVEQLQKIYVPSILATTGSVYTPQSSFSSFQILKNFNGEIAYVVSKGKNNLFKYYNAMKNFSFFNATPYLKEYYTRTLYGEPTKIFDPFLELQQSEEVRQINENLLINYIINPNYTIISTPSGRVASFKEAEYIDEIPILKHTIILPSDSVIKNISFDADEIQENLISMPITSNFWYETYKLLDNRTALELIIIPVTSSGGILTNITINVVYSSQLEITKISASRSLLTFSVYSSKNSTVQAIILIEGEASSIIMNQTLKLQPGLSDHNILLPIERYGNYSVCLMLEGDILTGAKCTYLIFKPSLSSTQTLLKRYMDFLKFVKQKVTYKNRVRVECVGDEKIIEYESFGIRLSVKIGRETVKGEMVYEGKKLVVMETPKEKIYELSSPEGEAVIRFSDGQVRESYTKPELMEELKKALSLYSEILLKVEEQYN
ncbi:MAG: DUF2341 domain-containing protein [Candidatus Aenigmatarchaeota archaeon]